MHLFNKWQFDDDNDRARTSFMPHTHSVPGPIRPKHQNSFTTAYICCVAFMCVHQFSICLYERNTFNLLQSSPQPLCQRNVTKHIVWCLFCFANVWIVSFIFAGEKCKIQQQTNEKKIIIIKLVTSTEANGVFECHSRSLKVHVRAKSEIKRNWKIFYDNNDDDNRSLASLARVHTANRIAKKVIVSTSVAEWKK